ncbi:hypothetical protein MLD52_11530 [Puniceicoccaceae bacterium K14]|nr:hypothetical protein [Puniceicoccaceae bacterium K14]
MNLLIRGYYNLFKAGFCSSKWSLASRSYMLPFNRDAPLKSYLFNAYPTGIITAEHFLDGPALTYHINLFFPDAKLSRSGKNQASHFRFFPGLSIEDYSKLGYYSNKPWTAEEMNAISPNEFISELIEKIENGIYIHAQVNDFFIPKTSSFRKKHRRHEVLLVGYDHKIRTFKQVSYTTDRVLEIVDLPIGLLVESLKIGKYRLKELPSVIEEISLESDRPKHMDTDCVSAQLLSYLHADRGSSWFSKASKFTSGNPLTDSRGTFGIGVYSSFRKCFRAFGNERGLIDLRATRTLMEHKWVIYRVFDRIAVNSQCRALANEYKNVLDLARRLQQMSFAVVGDQGRSNFGLLIKLLDEIEDKERRIMTHWLKAF